MLFQYSLIIAVFFMIINVAYADSAHVDKSMSKVGQAKVSLFNFDLYHTELFTVDGHYHQDMAEYSLKMTYLRDIKGKLLFKHTVKYWSKVGIQTHQYQPYLTHLEELCRDVKKGDRFMVHIKPQQTDFYFNEQYIDSIHSPEFGPIFAAMWLSPEVSKPHLRAQLIGQL